MGRAPCCDKNGLKKGPWTPEEDHKLVVYIKKHGCGNWRTLPKNAGLQRCGKSCRLRWSNYLRPDIKRGRFSFEEEETIIQLHSMLGNKWSAIAARLPGRTDNEIKNYWNTHIRKRLLRIGIDPVTHNPRLDLLDLSSLLSSTLYPNSSQMNLSNLLGLQPLLNPELLRIVCSLFPSSHQSENSPNYCLQNVQQIPQFSNIIQTQNQALLQNIETQFQDIPVAGLTQMNPATQLMEQLSSDDFTNCNASTQLSDVEWLRNNNLSSYECYLESEQNVIDQQPQNSKLVPYPYNDSNFTFPTLVLSTPPSSPSHLNTNSNSTHFNCSSTTTEDERESQSSDMFKFEISDILDVEKFM